MQIQGSVAVDTGANRGLGRHLAEEPVRRGAAKVYAAARNPEQITTTGVVPLQLDTNDPRSVAPAAVAAADATLLVNNAGNYNTATLLDGSMDDIRALMETPYFGTLSVTRAFAPALTANAPGRSSTSPRCCPGSTRPVPAPTAPPKPHCGLKPTRCAMNSHHAE
jgi:NAD(P)-dependent dehydrogenase (short-subunit alcohol dehydrogenase family)